MSQTIWTRCGGDRHVRPLAGEPWRVVEAQHRYSTIKLVDSVAEQAVLEELVDRVKPPRPAEASARRLHYLLYTPFRYPPLDYGSRFGSRSERSLWYGSEQVTTALAEKAYYLFVLLEGMSERPDIVERDHSAFRARLQARRGADLTQPPFDAHADQISDPTTYRWSQPLGAAMRSAGVEAFRFRSARDPGGGVNWGLFTPDAFSSPEPVGVMQTWRCTIVRGVASFVREHATRSIEHRFRRVDFCVGGTLPLPGVSG